MTTATSLATVTPLPSVTAARELLYRHYEQRPRAGDPIAGLLWRIEQQLDDAHRIGSSPYLILDAFAPELAPAARDLLDRLFDAADQVHAHERGRGDGTPVHVLDEAYVDCLYALGELLRRVAT